MIDRRYPSPPPSWACEETNITRTGSALRALSRRRDTFASVGLVDGTGRECKYAAPVSPV